MARLRSFEARRGSRFRRRLSVRIDQQADQEMLKPGKRTLLRVYVEPFGFVFRKGSAIRVLIDAPTRTTGLWAFGYLTTPAVNTIYIGPKNDSQLVLGLAPWQPEPPKPDAACNTIISQPSQPNQLSIPVGSLTIPPVEHRPTTTCTVTLNMRRPVPTRIIEMKGYEGSRILLARCARAIERVSFRIPTSKHPRLIITMQTNRGRQFTPRLANNYAAHDRVAVSPTYGLPAPAPARRGST